MSKHHKKKRNKSHKINKRYFVKKSKITVDDIIKVLNDINNNVDIIASKYKDI